MELTLGDLENTEIVPVVRTFFEKKAVFSGSTTRVAGCRVIGRILHGWVRAPLA